MWASDSVHHFLFPYFSLTKSSKMRFTTSLTHAAFVAVFGMFGCGTGGNNREIVELIPVKNGDEYQYIDREGKIVINPQFREATIFRDGLALVQTSGEKGAWGYITEDGTFAIQAIYASATVFQEEIAWTVTETGAPTAIGKDGATVFTLDRAEQVRLFREGFAAFSEPDSLGFVWGFVNKKGEVVIEPQFREVGNFSGGLCTAMNAEGDWGYIKPDGSWAINPQFDSAEDFVGGMAVVRLDENYGAIDEAGAYIINPQFDGLQDDGDRFMVVMDDKIGWADRKGKLAINPQFEQGFAFGGGSLASVQSGEKWGFVDEEGKLKINPQFDEAGPFNGGVALVRSGEKLGIIDEEGKYIANPQFGDVADDYWYYLLSGGSEFGQLRTNYFNLEPVLARLNLDSPEGLTFKSTYEDVLTTFGLEESDFYAYSAMKEVSDFRIGNDVYVQFNVEGAPFQEIPDGWYTRQVFDPSAQPTAFIYTITLSGRGAGKSEEVRKALVGRLEGYAKDEKRSSKTTDIWTKKGSQVVAISGLDGSDRCVVLFFPVSSSEGFDPEDYDRRIVNFMRQRMSRQSNSSSTDVAVEAVPIEEPMVDTTAYYDESESYAH